MLDMLSKNNLSLADLNMTPKVQTDQGIELGRTIEKDDERESVLEYQRKMADQMSGLRDMISRSRKKVSNDDILIEHHQEQGVKDADYTEVDSHG